MLWWAVKCLYEHYGFDPLNYVEEEDDSVSSHEGTPTSSPSQSLLLPLELKACPHKALHLTRTRTPWHQDSLMTKMKIQCLSPLKLDAHPHQALHWTKAHSSIRTQRHQEETLIRTWCLGTPLKLETRGLQHLHQEGQEGLESNVEFTLLQTIGS